MGTIAERVGGGFISIPVADLIHAWRACQRQPLGIGQFRAWLGLREMVARRCGFTGDRRPSYDHPELAKLLGVTERTASASVRRLMAAGLVEQSDGNIVFPAASDPVDPSLVDSIGGGRGVLVIPRRLLRWLARGARSALIAVALGALLRCVSRRRSGFDGRGRFKSSWVARVFGVAERHARSARAELVLLGWLEPDPADAAGQVAWNRWGRSFLVRLDWRAPRVDRPTLPADPGVRSSYPDLQPRPSPERKENPEPGGPRSSGARVEQDGAPALRDVRPADLQSTARVLALHQQAVAAGRISPSEADRLRFVAVAEHARAVGRANPCGLFAAIIRSRRWHLLTQADEDRARRRLRDHDRPAPIPAPPIPPRAAAPAPPQSLRSPYLGAERPAREPSALASILGRIGALNPALQPAVRPGK